MYNTLEQPSYMYNQYDYDVTFENLLMNNRLFCTFTALADLDMLVNELSSRYVIMYDKMFVLHIKSNNEYVVTYNVDQGNVNDIPDSTKDIIDSTLNEGKEYIQEISGYKTPEKADKSKILGLNKNVLVFSSLLVIGSISFYFYQKLKKEK